MEFVAILDDSRVFGEHFIFFSCAKYESRSGRRLILGCVYFVLNLENEELTRLGEDFESEGLLESQRESYIRFYISEDSSKSLFKYYRTKDKHSDGPNHVARFNESTGSFDVIYSGSYSVAHEIFVHRGFTIVRIAFDLRVY